MASIHAIPSFFGGDQRSFLGRPTFLQTSASEREREFSSDVSYFRPSSFRGPGSRESSSQGGGSNAQSTLPPVARQKNLSLLSILPSFLEEAESVDPEQLNAVLAKNPIAGSRTRQVKCD